MIYAVWIDKNECRMYSDMSSFAKNIINDIYERGGDNPNVIGYVRKDGAHCDFLYLTSDGTYSLSPEY